MPGLGGTGALLSVVVFGIALCQFLQTTPCERRFRTDAQLRPARAMLPLNLFCSPCFTARAIFTARAGNKEQTNGTLRDEK